MKTLPDPDSPQVSGAACQAPDQPSPVTETFAFQRLCVPRLSIEQYVLSDPEYFVQSLRSVWGQIHENFAMPVAAQV